MVLIKTTVAGGFKYYVHPYLGKILILTTYYFSRFSSGLKPLTRKAMNLFFPFLELRCSVGRGD